MTKPSKTRRSLWQIFRLPLLIGLLSVIGLISALVGDDVWDLLSWIMLAVPIAVIAGPLFRMRRPHER
ncbi:MAG: hypothetical protein QM690_10565 [Sphingobium sp.]